MQVCDEYFDTVTYRIANARDGSRNLLDRLIHYHDQNIRPPDKWRPRAVSIPLEEFTPIPIEITSVRKPIWFSIDDETVEEPKINDIKRAACRYFGVSAVDLDSARRTLKVVHPRQVAMYLARTLTGKSLPEIGRRFGGRDHTTVLHGVRKIELGMKLDWTVAYDVALVEALI